MTFEQAIPELRRGYILRIHDHAELENALLAEEQGVLALSHGDSKWSDAGGVPVLNLTYDVYDLKDGPIVIDEVPSPEPEPEPESVLPDPVEPPLAPVEPVEPPPETIEQAQGAISTDGELTDEQLGELTDEQLDALTSPETSETPDEP